MFLSLLKIRMQFILSGMFSKGKTGKKKNTAIGKLMIALLAIYVVGVLCFSMGMLFFSICEPFAELGLGWLYFAFAGIVAFVLSFVGSVFAAKTQLYEAADNEFLMSMPIKPSAILGSRMAALVGLNVIYQAIVLIPAAVVYIYVQGFSAAVLIMFILTFIMLPFLVITFTGIGGYLLQLISSHIPKKNILETVFYLAFLAVYFYFYSRLSTYMTTLMQSGETIAKAIQSSVFPAYCFGKAIADADILQLIYFALCSLVPSGAMYYLLSRNYLKIMGTKRGSPKVKYRGERLKSSSVKAALLKREMMHFLNNPMYIMNAALGTIFLIAAAVMLVIKRSAVLEIAVMLGAMEIPVPIIICGGVCAIASMNMISAPSVSIEGNSFWLIRSLPVETGDVLIAKAKCHFVVTAPAAIITAAVADIILKIDVLGILMTLTLPLAFIAFFSMLGVVINLHFPKMDWINEVYAVKQSASSIISMLMNMGLTAVPIVLYAFIFNDYMDVEIYTVIIGLIVAVGDIVMYNYLKSGGKRRFEAI